ncbi:2,3-bisphosphoglycerate-independent phosphoglycerate mutase [Helicobacter cholecystus]|uniref:2,3-bisphosphoglycerate-independent phosphoglycerate mutase n=1 Tax=Helicobacter cholecystus TaxID=45498 RepID=UPI00273A0E9B|nr:2,3-bisphosphoglycerate-independent phosphoglycerate mutase [Helicobacter cholecystus]
MQKAILIITDGIGHSTKTQYNAFYHAKTPTYDWLFANVPHSLLCTYGEEVGLPQGQMGNSEVGHITLGSGRIIFQDLLKISQALKKESFFSHPHFIRLFKCPQIHLVGLLSDGGVHSHLSHLLLLIQALKPSNRPIWLHLISDGRDVAPQSVQIYLQKLSPFLDSQVQIATLSGRYYAMDRDHRWERIQKAYEAMSNASPKHCNLDEYIAKQYQEGIYDEFIIPSAFNQFEGIKENDGIVFWNFRADRMRELSTVFANKNFSYFQRKSLANLFLLCFTPYDENLPLPTLFPKEKISNTLPEVLSQHSLTQAHIAETEKYAHVTFFFNGGVEESCKGEERILIPSPKVATYDLCPQMSAPQVGEAVRESMKKGFDFIVVNFANGDMVGHTGVFEAGIKAVECVDSEIGKILKCAKEEGYSIVLTSDHGNCEEMKDEKGHTLTNHTVGEVWCFVIDERVQRIKNGTLANIAPTILKLLNLPIPIEMQEPLF